MMNTFVDVTAFPLAERALCGFKRFNKEFRLAFHLIIHVDQIFEYFSSDQWNRITNYYHEEADRRKRTKKADIFTEEESQEETSILHSSGIYNMKNNINSTLIAYSSFPWEEFSGDMKILENEV